ncbi:hypothetical protein C900_04523 [Fulvivirga imtechensis AK7]|uniref:DUF1573 domain-containing protein n=1 Tax=Fulvivirga imtechensis AK7 TaxID=1237149 RepID=L8JLZ4_9BACT|nr:DUF1573 domain-containing protein [Fulvivirga imtechensis]ELR69820.1 hypothetical protein C900_04523 [Fulvivirga imtechensis AK7]
MMKRFFLISMFSFLALALHAQELALANKAPAAEINWLESRTFDFGKIVKDQAAEHVFQFTNKGTEPLIISSVKGSCGCTVTAFTKEPIPPGQTGEIKATYNAKSLGLFQKGITVISNAKESPVMLYVKGEVVEGK